MALGFGIWFQDQNWKFLIFEELDPKPNQTIFWIPNSFMCGTGAGTKQDYNRGADPSLFTQNQVWFSELGTKTRFQFFFWKTGPGKWDFRSWNKTKLEPGSWPEFIYPESGLIFKTRNQNQISIFLLKNWTWKMGFPRTKLELGISKP